MFNKKGISKYFCVMLVAISVMMVLFGCTKDAAENVEQEPQTVIIGEEITDENSSKEDSANEDSEDTTSVENEDAETTTASEENTEVDLEKTLTELQEILDGDSFVFDETLGKALYQCRTAQESAVAFTGEWNRTNVVSGFEAKLTISNQDANGFDVEGYVFWYSHSGELEAGHAFFITENVAVYEFYNDVLETYAYLLFYMEQDVLKIYATGTDADFGLGANCFWQGEYANGEPSYTNENVVQDNFTEEELARIRELIGEERYNSMFIDTLEVGVLDTANCVLSDGSKVRYYHSFIYGIATYNHFTLLLDENGEIYIEIGPDNEFFSTVAGVTEFPEYEIK